MAEFYTGGFKSVQLIEKFCSPKKVTTKNFLQSELKDGKLPFSTICSEYLNFEQSNFFAIL